MDEEIIEKLKCDRDEGIRLLKSVYGGLLNYIVSGILSDGRDAEECLNDIYMRICCKINSFDSGRAKLSSWITVIARNAAVDRLRKKGASESELHDDTGASPSPEDTLIKSERSKALSAALNELTFSERQLIYRKYYYLQSTAQIAAEMGVTERTVEGRLYRIRKRLRRVLGGDFDER